VEVQRVRVLRSILVTTGVALAVFTVLAAVFALVEAPDALALVPVRVVDGRGIESLKVVELSE
jgi:hypothetical protein